MDNKKKNTTKKSTLNKKKITKPANKKTQLTKKQMMTSSKLKAATKKVKVTAIRVKDDIENSKLFIKSVKLIASVTELTFEEAKKLYKSSKHKIKVAILIHFLKMPRKDAFLKLGYYNYSIKKLLEDKDKILSKEEKKLITIAKKKMKKGEEELKIKALDATVVFKRAAKKTTRTVFDKSREYTRILKKKIFQKGKK